MRYLFLPRPSRVRRAARNLGLVLGITVACALGVGLSAAFGLIIGAAQAAWGWR